MSYYCCRRGDLQYTIKAMLCLHAQSHMWQTVAAFIGLTSLFGARFSLVSYRQSKEKSACEYIPHASSCTPSSRKHNEQRDGFSCDLFSLLHARLKEKGRETKNRLSFWLYPDSRVQGVICHGGLQTPLFVPSHSYVRNMCSQFGLAVSESKIRSLVYPQNFLLHVFFSKLIPCLRCTDSKRMW